MNADMDLVVTGLTGNFVKKLCYIMAAQMHPVDAPRLGRVGLVLMRDPAGQQHQIASVDGLFVAIHLQDSLPGNAVDQQVIRGHAPLHAMPPCTWIKADTMGHAACTQWVPGNAVQYRGRDNRPLTAF